MKHRKETCENDVVFNCCVWLNQNGWYAWRNQSAGVWDASAKAYRRPSPFTLSGVSDIIAIRDGRTWFIECKFGKGDLSKDQELFKNQCEKHGVEFLTIWSVSELKNLIGRSTFG